MPAENTNMGKLRWWCFALPWYSAYIPTKNANATMMYSKYKLSMMFTPNKGRLLKNNGNNAQCMAQASDVAIPKASQLILNAIVEAANIFKCNLVAKYFKKWELWSMVNLATLPLH